MEGQLPDSANPDLCSIENEQITNLIKENNPTSTQEALRQVIMACSRRVGSQLSQQRAPTEQVKKIVTEEPKTKRTRSEPEQSAPEEFNLQRALMTNFH